MISALYHSRLNPSKTVHFVYFAREKVSGAFRKVSNKVRSLKLHSNYDILSMLLAQTTALNGKTHFTVYKHDLPS